jgi:hypothetical protein
MSPSILHPAKKAANYATSRYLLLILTQNNPAIIISSLLLPCNFEHPAITTEMNANFSLHLIVESFSTGAKQVTTASICNNSFKLINTLASEGVSPNTLHSEGAQPAPTILCDEPNVHGLIVDFILIPYYEGAQASWTNFSFCKTSFHFCKDCRIFCKGEYCHNKLTKLISTPSHNKLIKTIMAFGLNKLIELINVIGFHKLIELISLIGLINLGLSIIGHKGLVGHTGLVSIISYIGCNGLVG